MKRLGLDIGRKSIGWALLETSDNEATGIIEIGARIFSDGTHLKKGTSRAAERSETRQQRRMRDRRLHRSAALMRKMVASGLMPTNPEQAKKLENIDPFRLRALGIRNELPLTHFGRALFHLSKRRGFKSNRKTDRRENDGAKIKTGSQNLDVAMDTVSASTFGEFLHKRRAGASSPRRVPSVRTRLGVVGINDKGKEKKGYEFYPERHHLEKEFDTLWKAQGEHHSELSDSLRDGVREIIFFQRRLREQRVGRCRYYDEPRLAKSHPMAQRRILYETVNNLHIVALGKMRRQVSRDQRDKIIHALDNKKPAASLRTMNFKLATLAKLLKLAPGETFSLESIHRNSIACDPVRASLSHPDRFGPNWSKLDMDAQWEVIRSIGEIESDLDHAERVEWLESRHGLSRDNAGAVARAPLPDGYGALGETATRQILEKLRDVERTQEKVLTYSEAVAACGMHHSVNRTGKTLDALPYYGEILDRHVTPGTGNKNDDDITRYGRITNPTVHIALNQVRRLMNAIIERHGLPDEIVVELARDLKQSKRQRDEAQKRNLENRNKAEKRGETLREHDIEDNGKNRELLRLWEELNPKDAMKRCCPYSGKNISITMVFDGSCEKDHILPRSLTLDDSFANRTLCLKQMNREKGSRSPFQAWGGSDQWEKIENNLVNIPKNKRWRFQPDAMEKFKDEEEFLNRSLNDTKYLSRVATLYLGVLYPKGEGEKVRAVSGRLTGKMRRIWGLDTLLSGDGKKNRNDHRHHAMDAVVVACTDRGLVKRVSLAAKSSEARLVEKTAQSIPAPWSGFREDVEKALSRVIVSHRANHGRIDTEGRKSGRDSTAGGLHRDTALGIVKDTDQVVGRKSLYKLTAEDIAITTSNKNIRDEALQKALAKATAGKEGAAFKAAIRDFANDVTSDFYGIRRVRMIWTLTKRSRIEIKDKEGRAFKAYKTGSNHCLELWRMPDGKYTTKVVSTFDAHTAAASDMNKSRPHEEAKRVLRIFQRDMVALERGGRTLICYVQKFSQSGQAVFAEHYQANTDTRNKSETDPFKFIHLSGQSIVDNRVRRVIVDVMGRVRDPGAAMYN